jgi:hypothetical protein
MPVMIDKGAIRCHAMSRLLILVVALFSGSALAGDLGIADATKSDIERFTGNRSNFDALCGTVEREEVCKIELLQGRLIVNGSSSIPFSSITEVTFSRGGDSPGPTGHRLWGTWFDQTAIYYKDKTGKSSLAVFAFRHATTWMHFNLNLVTAKNGVAFQ